MSLSGKISAFSYQNVWNNWYFSTYHKQLIYPNATKKSLYLVKHHLAVFKTNVQIEDKDYENEYVASCVTFTTEGRVPAGKKYNVTISYYEMSTKDIFI